MSVLCISLPKRKEKLYDDRDFLYILFFPESWALEERQGEGGEKQRQE